MRSRITWRGVAGLALAAALLGGCGVATDSGVVRDGDGPRGVSDAGGLTGEPPKREDALSDQRDFVNNYLRVASADPQASVDRLRQYLTGSAAQAWQPDLEVTVVRQIGDFQVTPVKGGGAYVYVRLQPVGTLTEMGAVDPPTNRAIIAYTFDVQPGEPGQKGLFLTDPPPQILLLDTALASAGQLFLPYPIYFWDNEDNRLVPDLRYLSLSIPAPQRPTEVLRWLLAGPSSFLRQTAHGLPAGTELRRGNAYMQDDHLMVDLSAKAYTVSPAQLMPQLRWSLWNLYRGKIGLLIEGTRRATDDSPDTYRSENAAASMPGVSDVMCVIDKVVVDDCDDPGVSARPPAVPGDANRSAISAAVSADPGRPTRAALVREDGKSGRRLWVGQLSGGAANFMPTTITAPAMSRPVWLRLWGANPPTQTGLVAANGLLYRFVAAAGVESAALAVPVEKETRVLTGITAVATAPDARRIALVAAGRLYVAPLLVSRGTVTVGAARPLNTTLGELTAVTFNAQDRLLVAGQDAGRSWVVDVTVDGAIEARYERDLGSVKISQLVAYPDNPVDGATRGSVLIEADGRAARVFGTGLQDIGKNSTAPFYVD